MGVSVRKALNEDIICDNDWDNNEFFYTICQKASR
jgi:hypothetical protein